MTPFGQNAMGPGELLVAPEHVQDLGHRLGLIAVRTAPISAGLLRLGDAGASALLPLACSAALQVWAAAWSDVAAGLQSLAERLAPAMVEAGRGYAEVDSGLAALSGLDVA